MEHAIWREKGKRDRSKIFGSWSCPKCGHRLGEVWTCYKIERVYPLEEILVGPAFVLPLGVDLRGKDATKMVVIDGVYAKTMRAGWRLTEAKRDFLEVLASMDIRTTKRGSDGESLTAREFFLQTIKSHKDLLDADAIEEASDEQIVLTYLRSEKAPHRPQHVVPSDFPLQVICYSENCRAISQIKEIIPQHAYESFDRKSTYEFWE